MTSTVSGCCCPSLSSRIDKARCNNAMASFGRLDSARMDPKLLHRDAQTVSLHFPIPPLAMSKVDNAFLYHCPAWLTSSRRSCEKLFTPANQVFLREAYVTDAKVVKDLTALPQIATCGYASPIIGLSPITIVEQMFFEHIA